MATSGLHDQLSKHLRGGMRPFKKAPPPRQPSIQPTWHRDASSSSDACQGQAKRRQLGRASLASPIKQGGHIGSALNAFLRWSQRISLSTVDLSTSCVPLWQPLFVYKRRPEAYWRRIRIFWTRETSQLVQEHNNTQIYIKVGLGFYASPRLEPG